MNDQNNYYDANTDNLIENDGVSINEAMDDQAALDHINRHFSVDEKLSRRPTGS